MALTENCIQSNLLSFNTDTKILKFKKKNLSSLYFEVSTGISCAENGEKFN